MTLEGELVGVISYDVTRVTDRARVEAAAKLVALEADHARVTAQLAAGQSAAREPMARLVECNETERRRIARDLHDGLQNRLVLMGLGAQQIERDPTASDSVVEAVGQLRAELSASVAELRRLAAGVMPVTLVERGLFTAAEHFVSSLPIRTSLTLSGTSDDLPSAVESAAYFVVTEAATNVLKHSRADSVSIALERNLRRLRVVVVDNGVGGARQARRRRSHRPRRPAQRPRGPARDRQPTDQGDAGLGRDPVRHPQSGLPVSGGASAAADPRSAVPEELQDGGDPAVGGVVVGREPELGEDPLGVLLHRGERDRHGRGDGRVGPAGGHQRQDLALALGEVAHRVAVAPISWRTTRGSSAVPPAATAATAPRNSSRSPTRSLSR